MNQPRTTRRPVAQRRHFALHPLSLALMLGFTGTAGALPNAGTVVSGQVTIQNPSANLQVVTQASQRGIVDWKSFSIGSGQTVRFNQPSSSAVLLNRVTGYDPSEILGQMQANGRIFLLNPHGIVFGASARVDVGGMVASTLSLSNADFNAGRYALTSSGGRGALRNDGVITADGGTVALVAPKVTNTGTIEADGGRVGLAAADAVLVDVEGDGMVFFNASATGMKNRLEHLGRIQADGGTVEMRAAARAAMADTVLNMTGIVQARSLGVREGQVVIDGGARGITSVRGTIDASGRDAGESGGTVKVLGHYVGLFDGAALDASGDAGGGTVLVGGNFQGKGTERNAARTFVGSAATLAADALAQGSGGLVVVWSDQVTRFSGSISARGGAAGGDGGSAEVSGKQTLAFFGRADLRAPRGQIGNLLLDPTNINVVAGNANPAAFADGTLAFAEAPGDVDIGADTLNSLGATVTLEATNNLTLQTSVTLATANAGFIGRAGNNIALGGNTITTNGGVITLAANVDGAGAPKPAGTGSITGTGILITTATAGAASNGGDVTLSTSGTGTISVGSITARGRDSTNAAGGLGGDVQISTTDGAIGVGAIDTRGGAGGTNASATIANRLGGQGGDVTLTVSAATAARNIAVSGDITTTGGAGGAASGAAGGGAADGTGGKGGAGGAVTISTGQGNIGLQSIVAVGGLGGTGNDLGGAGGAGGAVDVQTAAGTLSLAAVTTTGGAGSAGTDSGSPSAGGAGDVGGTVTLSAGGVAGTVAVSGAINANGGQGGVGGDDNAGPVNTNADGGAGGNAAAVAVSSGAASVSVAGVSAVGGTGGAAGAGGGTAGGAGDGANITLTAATDLTVTGAVNSSTVGTTTVAFEFGQGGAGGTFTFGGSTVAADTIQVTGAGGTDVVVFSRDVATITLDANTLDFTGQGNAFDIANVNRFVISGGAGNNTIVLTGWAGLADVAVTGGTDSVTGTGANTTLVGTNTGSAFNVATGNAGNVVTPGGGGGTTTFTVVNNLRGGTGADTFALADAGSIASIDGGTGAVNTLDLSDKTTGFATINLETSAASGVAAFSNIGVLVGNGTDTRLTGRNIATTYAVSGTNLGSITNADGTINFSGVTRLIGGTNDDLFAFGNNALLRSIDGGLGNDTLSYATRGGAVTVNLESTDQSTGFVATAAGFAGIEVLTGNQGVVVGATTTLRGPDAGATFDVNAPNAGTVGTRTFTGVGSLVGGTGADSFVFTGTGALAGSLTDLGGTTTLSGAVATGTTQSYAGDVILGSPLVTVSSSGTGVDGAITFSGAVDATTAGVEALVVNTQGTTTFTLNVGANQRLASIETDAGGTTALPAIVRTVGDQNFADAATGTTVTLDASGPAAVTLGVGSDVDTLNVTVAGAASVLVNDADALAIGTFTIGGGTARFVVQDSIVRTTPLTLGGATLAMNVGGGVDVEATVAGVFGSALAAYTEVEVSAGTTAARDNLRIAGTGALEAMVVTGNLVVDATGPIVQSGALSVTGTSSFTAANQSVDLRNAANNFVGAVSVDVGAGSAGAVQIWDGNSLELGNLTLGTGFVQLVAGLGGTGDLTQTPGTSVTQALGAANVELYAFGGSVALTNPTNDFTGAVLLFAQGASAGVADQNNLTVDFSIFPNGPNTGITAIAGGTLTLQNAPLNFSTGLGDINLQSLGGALTLAPGTTLQTTSGNITLASAGNLTVQAVTTTDGDLSFSAVGGDVILNQNITTGGAFTFNTTGNFAGGVFSLDVGGAVTGSAGGSINLNGNFGGIGPLTAGTSIQVVDNEAGLFPATGLALNGDITANGGSINIETAGALALGNRVLTATAGANLLAVGISSTGGSVDGGSGLVVLNGQTGAVTLGSRTLAGETVGVGGGGGVTGSGAIDGGAGIVVVTGFGTGAIALTGAITTTSVAANAVALTNATSLDIGPITTGAGGTVILGQAGAAVGDINQTGIITAGTLTGVSTGNVTLGGLNELQQLGPFSAGGALTINNDAALTLTGAVTAGSGAVTLTAAGALNLGANTVSGTGATLRGAGISSTGGSISGGTSTVLIDGQGGLISLGGSVQTSDNTAGALVIQDASDVILNGGVSTGAAGTLTLGVGGDITGNVTLGATALLVAGTVTADTNGSVSLASTNASNNVAVVGAIDTQGTFSLRDNVGGLAINGAVDANSGAVDIRTVGALTMPGSVTGAGATLVGSSVTLNGGNVAGGAGTVQLTATGGNVSQTTGTITTSGALQVSATGSATFANPVTVGSLGASTVGGALTLAHTGNLTVSGVVGAGTLDLTAAGAIALNAAVTTTGTTTLDAGTTIGQTAALSTATLVATGPGGVTLTNGSNRIGTVSGSSTGGAFTIVDTDLGLTLGGSVGGTSVSLTTVDALALGANTVTSTGGNVVLSGNGVTGSAAVTAGGAGNIDVDGGGGTISLTGGLTAAGNAVVILDGGATTIGDVTAATVELGRTGAGNTLGSVAQTGGSSVNATLLTGAVTGLASLGNTNAVTDLGPFTAGSLVFGDAGGLTIAGDITTTSALGTLQITTTGALVLGARTLQSAGTLALSGSSLSQTAAGDVIAAGASTLDGGAGGIDLASDTNSFGGTVTLQRTGGAVNLHATGSLFVGSLDAVADQPVELVAATDLTLVTGGLLDIGTADLTLEATTGNLTISGNIVANVLDITAGGTIALAGNITTTGDQTYSGEVLLTGSVTMDAGASKIALQGGATGAGDSLRLVSTNAAADAISTGAAIDSVGQFTVEGNITLGGDVSGSGAQTYQNAVVLNAGTVTISAGAGNVTFASTVDGTAPGAQSLVVTTSGITRFDGTVGTGVALNNLTTDGGGSTVLAGAGSSGTPFVTTTGNQVYGDALDPEVTSIASDTLLRGNQVTFNGLFNANGFEIAFQVAVGSSRVDLQACKLEYSIVSPK